MPCTVNYARPALRLNQWRQVLNLACLRARALLQPTSLRCLAACACPAHSQLRFIKHGPALLVWLFRKIVTFLWFNRMVLW